jgi:hypothetical protein
MVKKKNSRRDSLEQHVRDLRRIGYVSTNLSQFSLQNFLIFLAVLFLEVLNARSLSARETPQKLNRFKSEVVKHPSYFPNLALMDCHLFHTTLAGLV